MQTALKNKKNLGIVGVLILGLILVRAFESTLFYDPFLEFFHGEIQNRPLPKFNGVKLFFGLFFRYSLNSLLTLLIVFYLFQERSVVKLTSFLLLFFFVILIAVLYTLLYFSDQPDYLTLFYIRRFLIQPLFLILFVPAFFYQRSVNSK